MALEIIIKFFVVLVLSILFGIERQISKKPVGFGTFIFVAVGSCSLGIIALKISPENPLPLLSAIVTGIGFLGAGALIKSTDKIFGFTSAAGIWLFAIIGLTFGIGEYKIGLITYVIVWIVVVTDKYLENKGISSYQRKVNIKTIGIVEKSKILSIFSGIKWKLVSLSINKKEKRCNINYLISLPREKINEISKELEKKSWIESFSIE